MPPTAEATTGLAFHIGSVTVSPKPSTRLFCTTTAARRCRALTRWAFSSMSSMGRQVRWTRLRRSAGSASQRPRHSSSTSAPSGSSLTPFTSGPTSMRCTSGGSSPEVVGEPGEHPGHVLEAVPAAHLQHEPGAPGHRSPVEDEPAVAAHRAERAVAPGELQAAVVLVGVDERRLAQRGIDVGGAELGVLGAERVEGGRDDPQPVLAHPLRRVGAAREDERVCGLDVGPQERPADVGEVSGCVAADVAAPDDVGAGLAQHPRQSGGLRVVQQDDVPGPHHRPEDLEVLGEHLVVVLLLGHAQRAAVAGHPVQHVVQPLGDGEELGVTAQHQPAGLHPGALGVGQQRLEHLGDATALRRGVDVPHGAPGQDLAGPHDVPAQSGSALRGQQACQPVEGDGVDLDFPHGLMLSRCAHGVPVFAPFAPLASLPWALPLWRGCATSARPSSPRCRPWPPRPARSTLARAFPTPTGRPRCWRRPRPPSLPDATSTRPGPASPSCCEAIAAHQWRFYGLVVDPRSEVLVTVGATEAIAAAVLALCEPGDEVVTFEPYYDSYAATIALAGAVRRTSVLRFPDFAVDEESLRAAFSERTRMVLLNTPHNPTGKVFTRAELELIVRARARARRVGGHRRGLRAPGLRRTRTHPGGHAAGDGGADPDDLLGGQDVLRDRLEGGLGQRAGRGGRRRAHRQAVPHLCRLRARSSPRSPSPSASGTTCMPAWPARCRPSGTCSWRACAAPGWRWSCRRGPTSSSPTPLRWGRVTPWSSAARLPDLAGVVGVPVSVFHDDPEAARTLVRFAFCKREDVLAEAVGRLSRAGRALA